jgi:hypothetical protein
LNGQARLPAQLQDLLARSRPHKQLTVTFDTAKHLPMPAVHVTVATMMAMMVKCLLVFTHRRYPC